jgi:hypothetical protein
MQISLLIASCWRGKRPTRRARSGYSTWRQSGSGWPIRRKGTVRLTTCTKPTCALIRGRKSLLQGGLLLGLFTSRPSSGDRTERCEPGRIKRPRRGPLPAAARTWQPQLLGDARASRTAEARDLLVDGFDGREDVNQLIPELGIGFGQLRRQRIALALERCCPTGWVLSWLEHSNLQIRTRGEIPHSARRLASPPRGSLWTLAAGN